MTPCTQEKEIQGMKQDIALLQQTGDSQTRILTKIDEKVDKILWFMLGITTSVIIALVVALI